MHNKFFNKYLLIISLLTFGSPATFAQGIDNASIPEDVLAQITEKKDSAIYLVRMADAPVVAYDGGISGLTATKPAIGKKIDPQSGAVLKYVDYLTKKQANYIASVKGKRIYNYFYSFSGFAVKLNSMQAAKLASMPGILSVEKDTLLKLNTNSTPDFLGLTQPDGLWQQLGGVQKAGEGVIVGIIDSGIWPENSSFSDRDNTGKRVFQRIAGWHGRCRPGEEFASSKCNQKVIGATWYNAGFGGDVRTKEFFPYEFISARDADSHGSHTASTAAGNYGVNVTVDGSDQGTISGMAPRARIAAYKVCWGRGGEGGCFGSDSVAAIDQAVADGVDVLNFSISGSRNNYLDAVEVAFLYAADAGIFVAASAGNSGPTAGTVAHVSPWLTTVAAGTKDKTFEGAVSLGNGDELIGASRAGVVAGDLIYAGDAGDPLCALGSLDSEKVTGKIVICDRGIYARVDKSKAVQMAGGIGMVLANTNDNSLNADLHYVPTVHVDHNARTTILNYVQSPATTATLSGNNAKTVSAPLVASFSSRGPNTAGGDLLKPDIMAPGVDILAAVSPAGDGGRNWDLLSGTSMSSPHIAGLAALIIDKHPDWSPMMVKSALMTSASTVTNEGYPIEGGSFAYGAGHVVPNSAVDPGLVYNTGFNDWLGFLCGTEQLTAEYCVDVRIDPSDLNYPSISIGELAGMQTIVRTVTNVGSAATYNVSVNAPENIEVTVTPASLTLDSGESASYHVTFRTTSTAILGRYANGSLSWSDGTHTVTSPLVVRPVKFAASTELQATGTDGSLSFDINFGYTGNYTATALGLIPADRISGNVEDDPVNDINQALGTRKGVTYIEIAVPVGTVYTRFSLFDNFTDGNDDLDLYVFNSFGKYVGGSGNGGSNEQVNLVSPIAGNYIVVVHGWQTDGPDANFTLFNWNLPATPTSDSNSLHIDAAPVAAVINTQGTVEISWSGLDQGNKYLGAVSHNVGGDIGLSLIDVTTE